MKLSELSIYQGKNDCFSHSVMLRIEHAPLVNERSRESTKVRKREEKETSTKTKETAE